MTEAEEPKKLEPESPSDPPPAPTPAPVEEEKPVVEAPKDPESHKDKSEILPPPPENKAEPDESKALAFVEKPSEPAAEEKSKEDSVDRDAVLARVATEKKLSLIRAWEESEKSKAENKAHKKLSAIGSWENTKKATVEAELKKIEEQLEKKKAEYVEQMKNKIALIPFLFDAVKLQANQFNSDCMLFFDCINEVLVEVYHTHLPCSPWVSFIKPIASRQFSENTVIHEVMKSVDRYLLPHSSPQKLQQIVEKDIACSGAWLDLRNDSEEVIFKMVEGVLEELIMETIF